VLPCRATEAIQKICRSSLSEAERQHNGCQRCYLRKTWLQVL
jgi:hypothetical protein